MFSLSLSACGRGESNQIESGDTIEVQSVSAQPEETDLNQESADTNIAQYNELEDISVQAPLLVDTAYGTVEGALDGETISFKGIPFAAPPIGDLRFAPPVEPTPWEDIKDCTEYGYIPVQNGNPMGTQPGDDNTFQSEDCLYLNIWRPAEESIHPLPVYVWIYGGGFSMGSPSVGTYATDSFARDGIIQVNITYRVNALGFLASDEMEAESGYVGNMGVLDQIQALKWVQENIAAFGGDPGNVTIGGESAGAFSVSNLIMSPLAKGLFHRAILESGNILGSPISSPLCGGYVDQMKENTKGLMEALGVSDLAGLRSVDAKKIAAASALSFDIRFPSDQAFWPVYDGKVLPEDPWEALTNGEYNDVPILTGYNTDEGSMFVPLETTDAQYRDIAKLTFGENAAEYLERYPVTDEYDAAARLRFVMKMGLAGGSAIFAEKFVEAGQDVYCYNFDYRTPEMDAAGLGASHASEMNYIFETLPANLKDIPEAVALSDRMHEYWANFIKTGDPNGDESTAGEELIPWEKYDTDAKQNIVFSELDYIEEIKGIDDINYLMNLIWNN
jgi:para-nitrobenzyl esterase